VRALVSQANNGIKGDGKKPLVSIGDIGEISGHIPFIRSRAPSPCTIHAIQITILLYCSFYLTVRRIPVTPYRIHDALN